MEAARIASSVDKEASQMRAHELAAGISRSSLEDVERIRTEGDEIVENTNDGVTTTNRVGSEKPDPPSC